MRCDAGSSKRSLEVAWPNRSVSVSVLHQSAFKRVSDAPAPTPTTAAAAAAAAAAAVAGTGTGSDAKANANANAKSSRGRGGVLDALLTADIGVAAASPVRLMR